MENVCGADPASRFRTAAVHKEPCRGCQGRPWPLAAALTVVFLIKLLVLMQLKDHPLTQPDAGLDTTAYVELARKVVDGNWGLGPGSTTSRRSISTFSRWGWRCSSRSPRFACSRSRSGQRRSAFLFLTTRRWFGERAAWIAAALAAFTGLFTFYEVLILQASVDAFLTSAALYFLARGLTSAHVQPTSVRRAPGVAPRPRRR